MCLPLLAVVADGGRKAARANRLHSRRGGLTRWRVRRPIVDRALHDRAHRARPREHLSCVHVYNSFVCDVTEAFV